MEAGVKIELLRGETILYLYGSLGA
jgi:hypothetical protein